MAKLWGASVAKSVGHPLPDCSVCRNAGFEENRKLWGCDRDADEAVFRTTCPRCMGLGCETDAECSTCGDPICNEGKKHWHRCPTSVVGSLADARFASVVDSYLAFDAHGILPVAGAWLDQSSSFAAAVRAFSDERARWDEIEAKHMERMRNASS